MKWSRRVVVIVMLVVVVVVVVIHASLEPRDSWTEIERREEKRHEC